MAKHVTFLVLSMFFLFIGLWVVAPVPEQIGKLFGLNLTFGQRCLPALGLANIAIVALFRRPFGLPIPHTGIVPNNQERIAVALGRFVAENFLRTRVAYEWLARVDPVDWAIRWINDPGGARRAVARPNALLVVRARPQQELRRCYKTRGNVKA